MSGGHKSYKSSSKLLSERGESSRMAAEQPASLEQKLSQLDSSRDIIVYDVLKLLMTRVVKGTEEIVKIRRARGIEKLLSIVPKLKPSYLYMALYTLGKCCAEEKSCYKFVDCDGINIIADNILNKLSDIHLRHSFARLISNLAVRDSCCLLIHERPEIIETIVRIFNEDLNDGCKQALCKAVGFLAKTDEHQDKILRCQGLKSMTLLLKDSNSEVVIDSMKTLSSFIKRCTEECARQLISGELLQSLVLLSTHNSDPVLVKYARNMLLKFPKNEGLRPYLGNNGALELYIQSAEVLLLKLESKEIGMKELGNLYDFINSVCLCCRDVNNQIKVKELGGIELLIRALKMDKMSAIFDRIISSFFCFAYNNEGLRMILTNEVFEILTKNLYRCTELSKKTEHQTPMEEEADVNEFDDPDVAPKSLPVSGEELDGGEAKSENYEGNILETADKEMEEVSNILPPDRSDSSNNITRYSIRSPTYQAVLAEQNLEEDAGDARHPRNIWEGVELFGDKQHSSSSFGQSPSIYNRSPLSCSSSRSSSPYQGSFSPMSVRSFAYSESSSGVCSPRSDVGDDTYRESSPCLLDKELEFSPLPLSGSLYTAPSSLRNSSASLSEAMISEDSGVLICGSLEKTDLDCCDYLEEPEDMFCQEDEDFSEYCSETFRKNRHYEKMLVKYELQDDVSNSDVGSISKTELTKSKRCLSPGRQTKIQKIVEGDITRSAGSCVNIEKMISELQRKPRSTIKKIPAWKFTATNIFILMWRALDLEHGVQALCSRTVIQGILDHVIQVKYLSRRATKLLLRITQKQLCFEALVKNGIPTLFKQMLKRGNDVAKQSTANHCPLDDDGKKKRFRTSDFSVLCEQLLCNLSVVAQSSYGEGVLSNILTRGSQTDKENCAIAFCFISRSHEMRKNYILKMQGLELLTKILINNQSPLFSSSVLGICYLMSQEFTDFDFERDCIIQSNRSQQENGPFEDDDLLFVFDRGGDVKANREELASRSDVFAALLKGHFVESTMSTIHIPEASSEAFQLLIQLIRNESITSCILRLQDSFSSVLEVLLEVLHLANQYLLSDVCEKVGGYICRCLLDENNAIDIINTCIALNCPFTKLLCIKCILTKITPLERKYEIIFSFVDGPAGREFVHLLNSALSEVLNSPKS